MYALETKTFVDFLPKKCSKKHDFRSKNPINVFIYVDAWVFPPFTYFT